MARSHDVLIPARFLLMLGQFVTVVLAFFQIVRRCDVGETQRPHRSHRVRTETRSIAAALAAQTGVHADTTR